MQDTLELLDHTAAAFGIELRFPFWDKRLVEFCLALPPEQKIRRGWTRYILRNAMDGILPPEIQWRGGKSNLGPGLEHGLLTYDRDRLEKILSQDVPRLKDYLDLDVVSKAYQRFLSEERRADDITTVCNAASLAVWLQDTCLRP
jgi:asparagine synthase (glutamine-hydrolysing)